LWVNSEVSTSSRIIIAVQVVVKPRFSIKILPCKSQVAGDGLCSDLDVSEGIVGCRPGCCSAGGCDLLRCAEVVVLIPVVNAVCLEKERGGAPLGIGDIAVGFNLCSGGVIFADQAFVGIYKICPCAVNLFP